MTCLRLHLVGSAVGINPDPSDGTVIAFPSHPLRGFLLLSRWGSLELGNLPARFTFSSNWGRSLDIWVGKGASLPWTKALEVR